jgi:hypothetical protein
MTTPPIKPGSKALRPAPPTRGKRGRGRPSKASLAASALAAKQSPLEARRAAIAAARGSKPTAGRPSARTLAARELADASWRGTTEEQRAERARAGGLAAPHPAKLSACPTCGRELSARAMRKKSNHATEKGCQPNRKKPFTSPTGKAKAAAEATEGLWQQAKSGGRTFAEARERYNELLQEKRAAKPAKRT